MSQKYPDLTRPKFIFIYGPPGSGKTTTGRGLANALGLSFFDLDEVIEKECGRTVAELFASEGEASFRERERLALEALLQANPLSSGVVALGGGTLQDAQNRSRALASGSVLCLAAEFPVLLERVRSAVGLRPLLGGNKGMVEKLKTLLDMRAGHYGSFDPQLDTTGLLPEQVVREAQIRLGWFRVQGEPGYNVIVHPGVLDEIGSEFAKSRLNGPVALVSDTHVAPLYAPRASNSLQENGYSFSLIQIKPGETHKRTGTLEALWGGFVEAGLERRSTVAALGGGVVGDLAGFAAATFLRGVAWAVLPTTLLAMCDSSIGGKTGADLLQGKNLIGAFHSPHLVLSDPHALETLPPAEIRSGLAEVVKAGVIGDPALFAQCELGLERIQANWTKIVSRAAAVKIQVIQADPYEKGLRAVLNLGHTIGHALEWASGYRLSHGEAVAAGMVLETRLSEEIGLAEPGLRERLAAVLRTLGLPVNRPPGIPIDNILNGMKVDKKRAQGKIHFALPVKIGEVRHGIVVEEETLWKLLNSEHGSSQ